jgi:hypothetical protein
MPSAHEPFFRAIRSAGEDQLVCRECQDQLSIYIVAERNAEDPPASWQAVRFHLEQCPHCMATYTDLRELLLLAENEQLRLPEQHRPADLRFLEAPKPASSFWCFDEPGRLIIAFSRELLDSLRVPAGQTDPAGVGLKSGGSEIPMQPLVLSETGDDLEVVISAEAVHGQANQVMLVVEVRIPSRGGWPNLAGSSVTLQRADLVETQITDAFGKVVFNNLSPDELEQINFEISPLR